MSEGLVQLLSQLVAIDSSSTKSNIPIVDFLERRLVALGLSCERQRYVDDAGTEKANLIARSGDAPAELALVGHSDCVPFDKNWDGALKLTERDGMLIGRGACDTKAFIACSITAFEQVRTRLQKPVMLVFTADEELGCVGAKKMAQARAVQIKRAIIGEPTSLRPIRANKGYCLAEIVVQGKEGHSAYPDTGASAVFRAARLVGKIEQYSKGTMRLSLDERFVPGHSTLNIGMLSGGKAKNVIPGECRMTLEWRPLPSQNVEEVLRAVEAMIAECVRDEPGFVATVTPLRMDRGFDTAAEADVVLFLEAQSGKRSDTVSFGTEGPQLAALGAIPVVFGPGDITVAHQTGEHVPVNELHAAARILEAALTHFAGEP